MEWMLLPLKRYADFSGRSRRKEYWMFTLGYAIMLFAGWLILVLSKPLGATALGIVILGCMIPSIAAQVRRFHDQDMSGWWALLSVIPYVGGLIVLGFMCRDGTRGPNRFGADPKGDGSDLAGIFA